MFVWVRKTLPMFSRPAAWRCAGVFAVAIFACLVARFWHPYYGFTRFIQLDEWDARVGISEVRTHRVFVYPGENGYDGAAYAQIAFHPSLDSPELSTAISQLPYRARRILTSALAYMFAAGNPARIADVYSWINIGAWLVFAVVLWRALSVRDLRTFCLWFGVTFSSGALHSVRLALTDLLATTLACLAVLISERSNPARGGVFLAAAGLARETALAQVVGLWRGPWTSVRTWAVNVAITVLVAAPLFAWMAYVRVRAGSAPPGFGNFSWPLVDWFIKGANILADFWREPNFRWLVTTTLLAHIALTAQAAFFITRRHLADPWWRIGLGGAVLMLFLGEAVWEGHPGAATRVLLPMSAAFAVLAARQAASWPWVLVAGLSMFSGVLALVHVTHDVRELDAGQFSGGAYVARHGDGWHGVEFSGRQRWAWSPGRAELQFETARRTSRDYNVELRLRGFGERPLEIRDAHGVRWQGRLATGREWIRFGAVSDDSGRIRLTLISASPPQPESAAASARPLSFALDGARLVPIENRRLDRRTPLIETPPAPRSTLR